jgi:hypothetical protein
MVSRYIVFRFQENGATINSRWIKEIDGVSKVVADIVKEKCTIVQRDRINIIYIYEEDAYLKGALMLVGEHVLENTENNRLID